MIIHVLHWVPCVAAATARDLSDKVLQSRGVYLAQDRSSSVWGVRSANYLQYEWMWIRMQYLSPGIAGNARSFRVVQPTYQGFQRHDRALCDPTPMDSQHTWRDPLRNTPRKEAALGNSTRQLKAIATCHTIWTYLDSVVTELWSKKWQVESMQFHHSKSGVPIASFTLSGSILVGPAVCITLHWSFWCQKWVWFQVPNFKLQDSCQRWV